LSVFCKTYFILWLGAIVAAFFFGQSSAPLELATQPLDSSLANGRSSTSPVNRISSSASNSRSNYKNAYLYSLDEPREHEDFVTDFETLLPDYENNPESHDALWMLADSWAAQHPERAVAWLSALSFSDARNPYLFSGLSQWASQDPSAAAAWVKQNFSEQNETLSYLKASLVRGIAKQDPDRAVEILLSIPYGPERIGALDFVFSSWAEQGSNAIFDGLESIPADVLEFRKQAIKKAVGHLPPEELPEIATSWAQELENAEERLSAQRAIAAAWGPQDTTAALAWATDLSDEAHRGEVIGEIATRWARVEPLSASAWLTEQEPAPELDQPARSIARSTIGISPDLAFSQIERITSEAFRRDTFEHLGRTWLADQPSKARAYFEKDSAIPLDIRTTLLSYFR